MSHHLKIVIAPQAFKGSLGALAVAEAIADGIRRIWPEAELVLVPAADGGEGTVRALVEATGGQLIRTVVTGPLGEPVEAEWGVLGDGHTAVIEMAAASGLPLVPPERRNPLVTTTVGTGELIRAALDAGCRRLIIGIGGSATNDAGAGMAQALGAHLLDRAGRELARGGAALAKLDRIDVSGLDPRLAEAEVRVACDVTNPLTGPTGASAVYGPQKGATPEMVAQLDAALARFAAVAGRDLSVSVRDLPGAGAAGGLGAGLVTFLHGRLEPGARIVLEAIRLAEHLEGATLCFTGEGRIDAQTVYGKTPAAVAELARARGVPTVALAGSVLAGYEAVYEHGIDAVLSIVPGPMPLEEASAHAPRLIADAAERALRLIRIGTRWPPRHTASA